MTTDKAGYNAVGDDGARYRLPEVRVPDAAEYETDEERDAVYGSHIDAIPGRPFHDATDDDLKQLETEYGIESQRATHVEHRAAARHDLQLVQDEIALRSNTQLVDQHGPAGSCNCSGNR